MTNYTYKQPGIVSKVPNTVFHHAIFAIFGVVYTPDRTSAISRFLTISIITQYILHWCTIAVSSIADVQRGSFGCSAVSVCWKPTTMDKFVSI